jgi:hypothetical protein
MTDKKQPGTPQPVTSPIEEEEINPLADPAELIIPDEDPDIIPDEDPFENPPYEEPEPGEGP